MARTSSGASCTAGTEIGGDESVAAPRQGFDEPRIVGGVVQRFAQLADGAVQPDLEVDERVRGPEHASELVARDHFTGTAQQFFEDLEGLIGQPDFQAMTPQLAGLGVELEHAEAEDMRRRGIVHSFLRVVEV